MSTSPMRPASSMLMPYAFITFAVAVTAVSTSVKPATDNLVADSKNDMASPMSSVTATPADSALYNELPIASDA